MLPIAGTGAVTRRMDNAPGKAVILTEMTTSLSQPAGFLSGHPHEMFVQLRVSVIFV